MAILKLDFTKEGLKIKNSNAKQYKNDWSRFSSIILGVDSDPFDVPLDSFQKLLNTVEILIKSNKKLVINTSSSLCLLLSPLLKNRNVQVKITVELINNELHRSFNQSSSRPLERIETFMSLKNSGVNCLLELNPVTIIGHIQADYKAFQNIVKRVPKNSLVIKTRSKSSLSSYAKTPRLAELGKPELKSLVPLAQPLLRYMQSLPSECSTRPSSPHLDHSGAFFTNENENLAA